MLFAFGRVSSGHASYLYARVYLCMHTESKVSLFIINGHSNLIYYYILQKAKCFNKCRKSFWVLKISDWPSFTSVAGIKPDFRFQFVTEANSGQQEFIISGFSLLSYPQSRKECPYTQCSTIFSTLTPSRAPDCRMVLPPFRQSPLTLIKAVNTAPPPPDRPTSQADLGNPSLRLFS